MLLFIVVISVRRQSKFHSRLLVVVYTSLQHCVVDEENTYTLIFVFVDIQGICEVKKLSWTLTDVCEYAVITFTHGLFLKNTKQISFQISLM